MPNVVVFPPFVVSVFCGHIQNDSNHSAHPHPTPTPFPKDRRPELFGLLYYILMEGQEGEPGGDPPLPKQQQLALRCELQIGPSGEGEKLLGNAFKGSAS